MVQQFKETGHPIFISTSALSRGILKQRRGKSTIHLLVCGRIRLGCCLWVTEELLLLTNQEKNRE